MRTEIDAGPAIVIERDRELETCTEGLLIPGLVECTEFERGIPAVGFHVQVDLGIGKSGIGLKNEGSTEIDLAVNSTCAHPESPLVVDLPGGSEGEADGDKAAFVIDRSKGNVADPASGIELVPVGFESGNGRDAEAEGEV